jgi:hypothetical protein
MGCRPGLAYQLIFIRPAFPCNIEARPSLTLRGVATNFSSKGRLGSELVPNRAEGNFLLSLRLQYEAGAFFLADRNGLVRYA